MTSLLLRADGGPSIGVGHLSRCLAFAEAAVARGWSVTLSGDLGGTAWLATRFADLGVRVVPPSTFPSVDLSVDADVVLVDHYGLGELPPVRGHVISLEDGHYGRRAADIVVDPSLAVSRRPADGSGVVLTGPRYAPIRADVRSVTRSGFHDPPKVVVVMGGGAASETVTAALTALRDTKLPLSAVALSAGSVVLPSPAPGQHFSSRPPTPSLPSLLADADLVVSAAGVTLTELCCIGAPAALVQLVENQSAGYQAAVSRGLAAGLGTPADLPHAPALLHRLLQDPTARAALSDAASSTVDGQGVDRVLDAATLTVRDATMSDADTLLEWRNDPETLKWSRGHQPVTRPIHESWLHATTTNPDRLLLIVERAGDPLGTVRFDRVSEAWEVSITVAPAHRGRGEAARLLMMGEGTLRARTGARELLANIHQDNKPSRALFERAGYTPAGRPADGPFLWLVKRWT